MLGRSRTTATGFRTDQTNRSRGPEPAFATLTMWLDAPAVRSCDPGPWAGSVAPPPSRLPCYGHLKVTGHTNGASDLGSMHALVHERPGVAAAVELDGPRPARGDVLVRVRATGIGEVARDLSTGWQTVSIDPPPAG
jgi:hypothetical protein